MSVSLSCPRLGSIERAVIVNENHIKEEEPSQGADVNTLQIERIKVSPKELTQSYVEAHVQQTLVLSQSPTEESSYPSNSSSKFPSFTLSPASSAGNACIVSLAMGYSRAHPKRPLKPRLKLHLLVFTKLKGCPLLVLRLRLQSRQAMQSVLRPNRPVPRSRRALLTLRHEDLPRSCTQHILEHKIRYVGGWLGVDAVLIEFPNICFPAEDAGLMPRWVDNGCADTVTIGIAVTELRTKA